MRTLLIVLGFAFMTSGCGGENGLRMGWFAAEQKKSQPDSGTGANPANPSNTDREPPEPAATPAPTPSPSRSPGSAGGGTDDDLPEPRPRPRPTPTAAPTTEPMPAPRPAPTETPRPEPTSAPMPEPEATPQPSPSPTSTPDDSRREALEEVLELTNAYREKNGLSALTLDSKLSEAAQAFAERMAKEDFFDHYSPGGDSPGDRIAWAGYRWLTWGENIARGYRGSRQVVGAWIKSPPHRANLLNPYYTQVGLGFAFGDSDQFGRGCAYWVQEFGVPAPHPPSSEELQP